MKLNPFLLFRRVPLSDSQIELTIGLLFFHIISTAAHTVGCHDNVALTDITEGKFLYNTSLIDVS
jgi:hypothetical protein